MPLTLEACAVADRIMRFLRSQYGEQGRMLRIETEDGRVVLRGQAQTFYQKQLWLQGAMHVAGPGRIVDLTEVDAPYEEVN